MIPGDLCSILVAAPVKTAEQLLIEKADYLYAENNIVELYDLLTTEKHTYKPELLWRLARAACDRGKLAGKEPERRTYIYEAYAYIKRALDVCQDNYAIHKVRGRRKTAYIDQSLNPIHVVGRGFSHSLKFSPGQMKL